MSLVSLAIISNNQHEEVMYIRDFSKTGNTIDDVEYDLFDLPPKHSQGGGSSSSTATSEQHPQHHPWDDCSLRHQFLLHAALEKLNEGTRNNSVIHRMRVLFLCCADDFRYYGMWRDHHGIYDIFSCACNFIQIGKRLRQVDHVYPFHYLLPHIVILII